MLLTARLLGVDLELQVVNVANGEHRQPAYLAVNPNGMVPTLDDAGFVLWESNAIAQYLATTRADTRLFPSVPRARADVSRWQLWDVAHWAGPVQTLAFERMYKVSAGLGEADASRVETALGHFRRCAAVLDGQLAKQTYLVGDQLTLADVSIACGLTFAEASALPVDDYQNLRRWFSSIERLDQWKTTAPREGA